MEKSEVMEKLTKLFVALVVLAIVGSFVALVVAHIFALKEGAYHKSYESQETIFIAALTLGLMIVLIIPHIINKEQIKRSIGKVIKQKINQEIEDCLEENYHQLISKSARDYAHISRMIAYILKHKRNYYWAMTWAGDSVVAYIRRFKEFHDDFQLNEEYFTFSLKIMKKSFYERGNGTFLTDNVDLEEYDSKSDDDSKCIFVFKKYNLKLDEKLKKEINDKIHKGKKLTPEEKEKIKRAVEDFMNEINDKIHKGKELTPEEKEISAVRELKRVILRYIKWQCIIYIEIQEHKKLPNNVIHLMKEYLDPAFKTDFKDMVNNTLNSFHYVDEEQFINDIVEKVEPEEREKVHEYLENMFKKELKSV